MRGHIEWCQPGSLVPPHGVKRPQQVTALARDMAMRGWQGEPLIGYYLSGVGLQLLSGTHRRAAAQRIGMRVPVHIYPHSLVVRCWGRLNRWLVLMRGQL